MSSTSFKLPSPYHLYKPRFVPWEASYSPSTLPHHNRLPPATTPSLSQHMLSHHCTSYTNLPQSHSGISSQHPTPSGMQHPTSDTEHSPKRSAISSWYEQHASVLAASCCPACLVWLRVSFCGVDDDGHPLGGSRRNQSRRKGQSRSCAYPRRGGQDRR